MITFVKFTTHDIPNYAAMHKYPCVLPNYQRDGLLPGCNSSQMPTNRRVIQYCTTNWFQNAFHKDSKGMGPTLMECFCIKLRLQQGIKWFVFWRCPARSWNVLTRFGNRWWRRRKWRRGVVTGNRWWGALREGAPFWQRITLRQLFKSPPKKSVFTIQLFFVRWVFTFFVFKIL